MHKWITFPHREGVCSKQAHADFPEEAIYEREAGRSGFFGPAAHFHHQHAPTGWSEWEGDLRPRAFDFNLVETASQISPWAVPHLLHNANCKIRVWRMDEKMDFLVRNADGDELLFLLAKDAKASGYTGGVVGTQMSNLGLEQALAAMEVPFKRAKVGDRYVMEQLKATGWRLGGEGSGHLLSLDHASTGDAIIASLRVLTCLLQQEATLFVAKQGMHKLPQTLINVRYTAVEGIDPLESEQVKAAVANVETELGDSGRVLLRKSGTEPLIRVMVEAVDAEQATSCAEKIAASLA